MTPIKEHISLCIASHQSREFSRCSFRTFAPHSSMGIHPLPFLKTPFHYRIYRPNLWIDFAIDPLNEFFCCVFSWGRMDLRSTAQDWRRPLLIDAIGQSHRWPENPTKIYGWNATFPSSVEQSTKCWCNIGAKFSSLGEARHGRLVWVAPAFVGFFGQVIISWGL